LLPDHPNQELAGSAGRSINAQQEERETSPPKNLLTQRKRGEETKNQPTSTLCCYLNSQQGKRCIQSKTLPLLLFHPLPLIFHQSLQTCNKKLLELPSKQLNSF
jgi:hypothetical protein